MDFRKLLQQWVLLMIGVLLASHLIGGIHYESFGALIAVVLILSFLNLVLRPALIFLALPFVVVTMGFGILVINAFLFLFVGKVVPGFHVDGFWSAFWGALMVSFVSLMANMVLGLNQVKVEVKTMGTQYSVGTPPARKEIRDDDVIDI